MDPLSLRDVSNGLGDTAGKKKKKKSNKIAPVEEEGNSGAAPTEHQNDKTPQKLKPLKLKSAKKGVVNGVSQAETTAALQTETHAADIVEAHADSAADEVPQNSGDRETGGREVKMIEQQNVPPWWKPPLGSDPVAGAEADHARVENWRDGRDYAMQARRENQPHVPAKELYESSKSGSPEPFSLCLPVFSQREPNLSDLGVGICLYFDTLRAYGVLFFGLFLLNSLSIIITFATNPMAGKEAMEDGGVLAIFRVITIGAMFQGSVSNTKGCNEDVCVLAPELGLDGTVFGTPAVVPLKYVSMALSYLDLLSAIIFLLFTGWFRRRINRMDRKIDDNTISLSDYSVLVSNLSRRTTSLALKAHFDIYNGKVCPERMAQKYHKHYLRILTSLPSSRVAASPDPETGDSSVPLPVLSDTGPNAHTGDRGAAEGGAVEGGGGAAAVKDEHNAPHGGHGKTEEAEVAQADSVGREIVKDDEKKPKKKKKSKGDDNEAADTTRKKTPKKAKGKKSSGSEDGAVVSATHFGMACVGPSIFLAASPVMCAARASPTLSSARAQSPQSLHMWDVGGCVTASIRTCAALSVETCRLGHHENGDDESNAHTENGAARRADMKDDDDDSMYTSDDVCSSDEEGAGCEVVLVAGCNMGQQHTDHCIGVRERGEQPEALSPHTQEPCIPSKELYLQSHEAYPHSKEGAQQRDAVSPLATYYTCDMTHPYVQHDACTCEAANSEEQKGEREVVWVAGCDLGERDTSYGDSLAVAAHKAQAASREPALDTKLQKKKKNKQDHDISANTTADESPEKKTKKKKKKIPENADDLQTSSVSLASEEGTATGGSGRVRGYGASAAVAAAEGKEEANVLSDTAASRREDDADDVGEGQGGTEGDSGPWEGVAAVYMIHRCSALLETLKERAPLMEQHFLLSSKAEGGLWRGHHLEMTGMRLRHTEEKVHAMCVSSVPSVDKPMRREIFEGAAIHGNAQDVVGALVIFNSNFARDDCLRHYSTTAVEAGGRPCGGIPNHELMLDDKRLTVVKAPEPSDLLWENLEVGLVQRYMRKWLANGAALLIILISFASVVSIKVMQQSREQGNRVCASIELATVCNAQLDWSSQAPASGCGGGPCSLGDMWGVTSLMALPTNSSSPLASPAVRAVAQRIVAKTPFAPDYTSMGSGDATFDLLVADACRHDDATGIFLLKSELSERGHAGHDCLAKVVPSEAQATALLHASFLKTDFVINVSVVSGSGEVRYENVTGGASKCTECICRALMNERIGLWRRALSYPSAHFQLGDGSGVCDKQFVKEMELWALMIAAIAVVVLFNVLMRVVVEWLSAFKREQRVSLLEAALAKNVFLGQFANTALVTVIVYAQIQPVSEGISTLIYNILTSLYGDDALKREQLHRDIVRAMPFFSGRFADLSPEWYGTVGIALLITVLTNLILPFIPLVMGMCNWCIVRCWCCQGGTYTKRSLARRVQAPLFQLGARYGLILNLVFTSLLLTPGMPALWLVAALLCGITYVVDKWVLLRFSRTPVNYSSRISRTCLGYFKYAAVLHMGMSVWTYSAHNQNGASFPRLSPFVGSPPSACATYKDAEACTHVADCVWKPLALLNRNTASFAEVELEQVWRQDAHDESHHHQSYHHHYYVLSRHLLAQTNGSTSTPAPLPPALMSVAPPVETDVKMEEGAGGACEVLAMKQIYSFNTRIFNLIT